MNWDGDKKSSITKEDISLIWDFSISVSKFEVDFEISW